MLPSSLISVTFFSVYIWETAFVWLVNVLLTPSTVLTYSKYSGNICWINACITRREFSSNLPTLSSYISLCKFFFFPHQSNAPVSQCALIYTTFVNMVSASWNNFIFISICRNCILLDSTQLPSLWSHLWLRRWTWSSILPNPNSTLFIPTHSIFVVLCFIQDMPYLPCKKMHKLLKSRNYL